MMKTTMEVILTLSAETVQLSRIYGDQVENVIQHLGRVIGEIANDDWNTAGLRLRDITCMLPEGANVRPTLMDLSMEILQEANRRDVVGHIADAGDLVSANCD